MSPVKVVFLKVLSILPEFQQTIDSIVFEEKLYKVCIILCGVLVLVRSGLTDKN